MPPQKATRTVPRRDLKPTQRRQKPSRHPQQVHPHRHQHRHITQIWRGSVTFANASEKYSYVYDAANQLIRENLYYGTGNSNNATITYQYDSWGNLLYKRTYAYTTGTLGTVQETVTYTYGNSSWKDQLTSYNGQSIIYDASGNPTTFFMFIATSFLKNV